MSGAPAVSRSCSAMVTLGASPATKYWPFAGVEIDRSTLNSGLFWSSFAIQSCALTIDGATPSVVGWWQTSQLSEFWMPPLWLVPVAKLVVSWHEPHTLRDGLFIQLSESAPL